MLLPLVRENQGLEGLGVKQGELGDDHEEDRNVEGKASILDPESLPTEVCDAVQPKICSGLHGESNEFAAGTKALQGAW